MVFRDKREMEYFTCIREELHQQYGGGWMGSTSVDDVPQQLHEKFHNGNLNFSEYTGRMDLRYTRR